MTTAPIAKTSIDLSNSWTGFARVGFTALGAASPAMAAAYLYLAISRGHEAWSYYVLAKALTALLIGVWLIWYHYPLKRVRLASDRLIISGASGEYMVPLAEIDSVRQSRLWGFRAGGRARKGFHIGAAFIPFITVTLRHDPGCGRRIRYLARLTPDAVDKWSHPDVALLRGKISAGEFPGTHT